MDSPENTGWLIFQGFATVITLVVAVVALVRTVRIERKAEKRHLAEDQRNLIKERDALLDRALQAQLTLDNLAIRIVRLLSDWPQYFSEREIEDLADQLRETFPLSSAVREQRFRLKEAELTTELIDGMSNVIRENQMYASDISDIIREQFEERIKNKNPISM